MIAVEQGEERRLRAGRSFDAAEPQRGDAMLDLLQVDHQILRPERRALADGGELGRLKVRVAERRQILPFLGERAQRIDRVGQPRGDQPHRLAHDDQVGVVDDVLRRRAEMDDPLGRGGGLFERVDVGHHVVPQALLPVGGPIEIDVVELRLHLRERLGVMRVSPARARSGPAPARAAATARTCAAAENSRSISGLALRVASGDS